MTVLVPMLGRPHTVAPLVTSIRETSDAAVLFICSPGDRDVHDAVDAADCSSLIVEGPHPGDYARKINAGVAATFTPLIFTGACDLRFHPGWFDAAVAALGPGIGVVGTNDLGSPRVMAGEHSTHSLVTRAYVERFGTIDEPGKLLHEGYEHEFVDDELVATAKHRNAWAFAEASHVEHLHPNWGKAPMDDLYSKQATRMRRSRRTFQRRRRLWT